MKFLKTFSTLDNEKSAFCKMKEKYEYFKKAQRSPSQQLVISFVKTSAILMEFIPLCRDISVLLSVFAAEHKNSLLLLSITLDVSILVDFDNIFRPNGPQSRGVNISLHILSTLFQDLVI
jgi:hypothetical protein